MYQQAETEAFMAKICLVNFLKGQKPFDWIRFGSIYSSCVLKGFNTFIHNIYEKTLLHPGPLAGFVLAVCTNCILKGLRMYVYTNYLQDWIT